MTFFYRENGSPAITNGRTESEPVTYQGIASLTGRTGAKYIAVGDYYDGHAGLKPGVLYKIEEVNQ